MLRNLHIKNFIIVENTEINFSNGFTVFSGETGAGKSILIDAISLVIGHRITDSRVLRDNSINTEITATFDTTPSSRDWLEKHGFNIKDQIVLKRIIDKNSRSKAYINNIPSSIINLRSIGSMLVKIYGQHAYQDLLNTESQRSLLDTYGELSALLQETKRCWKKWRSIKSNLESAIKSSENLQSEMDNLKWQEKEISQINFSIAEWEDIQTEHKRLSCIESISETCNFVLNNLDGDKTSIYGKLNTIIQCIQQIMTKDRFLENIHKELNSAYIIIKEIIHDLNNYISKIELDSKKIEFIESRMNLIIDTSRKLKVNPNELNHLYKTITDRIDTIKNVTNLREIEKEEQLAKEKYKVASSKLSLERINKAKILSNEVTKIIQSLSMANSNFDISITEDREHSHGKDNIEFLISHPGTSPKKITKIASGGELSRIYLAISVITNHSNVPTLIFDEIDNGIGGAIAETVGKLLYGLGKNAQVLCVTHLPQVAAYSENHFTVYKYQEDDSIFSNIKLLSYNQKIEEIARMLGGIKITTTTIHHAKEMVNNAKKIK